MKNLVLALALTTAFTPAALAGELVTSTGAARPGPVVLSEAQLDTITAGKEVKGSSIGSDWDLLAFHGGVEANRNRGSTITVAKEVKGSTTGSEWD
jgi:hypothetical protein